MRFYSPDKDEDFKPGYFDVAKPTFNPTKKLLSLNDLFKHQGPNPNRTLGAQAKDGSDQGDNFSGKGAIGKEDADNLLTN